MAIVCNGATNILRSTSFGASRPSAYSIASWWKPSAAPSSTYSAICMIGDTAGFPNDSGDLVFIWGNATAFFRNRAQVHQTADNYVFTTNAGAGTADVWVHKIATYAAGRLRQYENGTLIGADISATVTAAQPADWRFNASPRLSSKQLMLAYWDVELSSADCAALGKGFSPARVRPQSLRYFVPGLRNANPVIGENLLETDLTYDDDNPRIIW